MRSSGSEMDSRIWVWVALAQQSPQDCFNLGYLLRNLSFLPNFSPSKSGIGMLTENCVNDIWLD